METHGNTFGLLFLHGMNPSIALTVNAPVALLVSLLVTMQLTSFLPSLVMTTSVKLEHHKEKRLAVALLSPSMLTGVD